MEMKIIVTPIEPTSTDKFINDIFYLLADKKIDKVDKLLDIHLFEEQFAVGFLVMNELKGSWKFIDYYYA